VEMTGRGKRGKPKAGFPSLPTALGNRTAIPTFPHSHSLDDDSFFALHKLNERSPSHHLIPLGSSFDEKMLRVARDVREPCCVARARRLRGDFEVMAELVRISTCPCSGYQVGAQREVPEDPTDLAVEGLPIIGCNRLRCLRCGVPVRNSVSPEALRADPGPRVYSCDCRTWREYGVQALEDDDPETFRASPDVPWECEGHPAIVPPHDIDGGFAGSQAELVTLARRAVHGEYPPRTRSADTAKGDWLVRFRARLHPANAAAVTSAVTDYLDDPDPHTRARALHFFTHVWDRAAQQRLLGEWLDARRDGLERPCTASGRGRARSRFCAGHCAGGAGGGGVVPRARGW